MKKVLIIFVFVGIFFIGLNYVVGEYKVQAAVPYQDVRKSFISDLSKLNEESEKIGDYYFWINGNWQDGYKLYASKNDDGSSPIIVKTFKENPPGDLVTNGKTIYYSVGDWENGTVYKITIGKKAKKVFSVEKLKRVAGVYKNKIYYIRHEDENEEPWASALYVYDIKKKTHTKLVDDFAFLSSYGRYVLGNENHSDVSNTELKLYDAKKRKCKMLQHKAIEGVVSSKGIRYSYIYEQNPTNKYRVYSCDLSGENNTLLYEDYLITSIILLGRDRIRFSYIRNNKTIQ